MTSPTPTAHWLTDLLNRRYGEKNEGRIIRQPVGFDFRREPFDPSSYYKQIGTFRDISRAATNVVNQEVANRITAERERQQAAIQTEMRNAILGIQPNYTYGSGDTYSHASRGLSVSGADHTTPHTMNAINYFAPRHGISNVGGWRAHGSVPNSDHPKGRAADFMTRNLAQGNALAQDLINNASKWRVSYVIWNRAIWTPGRGWRQYFGPSPHTDHVHASFYA